MKETMKAVVVNAPGDFGVYEIDKPICPEGGMLVKVIACGLCGSDLRTLRSGHHRIELPFTIGHEISGEVEQLGNNYSGNWEIGDKLAISPLAYCGKCNFCRGGKFELCNNYKEIGQHWQGGLAEYIAIPEEAVRLGTILKIPDGLDPDIATLVEPLSSCVNAQEAGEVGLGDVVVIIGAGPIGTFHVELARARGAETVIVADISDDRLKLMEQYQPDFLIDSTKIDLVSEIRKITNGYGADVVITANPAPESQIQAVQMAKKGGRILLFGGLPKEKSTPQIDMNIVHYNALKLIGTTIFSPRHNQIALKLVADGKISGDKFISHIMPLNNFVEGAKLALAGKARKVVFKP